MDLPQTPNLEPDTVFLRKMAITLFAATAVVGAISVIGSLSVTEPDSLELSARQASLSLPIMTSSMTTLQLRGIQ